MKTILIVAVSLSAFLCLGVCIVSAQTTIISKTSGPWSDVNTWNTGTIPTALDSVVIRTQDSVTVFTGPVSCNSLTVNGIIVETVGTISAFTVTNVLTLSAASYFYLGTLSALPAAIKNVDNTSTIILYGAQSTCTESTIGNLEIRSCGIHFTNNKIIRGDLIIRMPSSGCTLAAASTFSGSLTHTVMGNVFVLSGVFSCIDGAAGASVVGTWNIHGNVLVTAASSGLARFGCFSSSGAVGTGIYNIDGNLTIGTNGRFQAGNSSTAAIGDGIINLKGDFTIDTLGLVNSNNLVNSFSINFKGTGIQTFTNNLAGGTSFSNQNTLYDTIAVGSTVVFKGNSGWRQEDNFINPKGKFVVLGTVRLGTFQIAGIQDFELKDGATLSTDCTTGFEGNFSTATGIKTLSIAANYEFTGSAIQLTGTLMPDTVYDLTINNITEVFQSQEILVNHNLYLIAGLFHVNQIKVCGSVVTTGGSISQTPATCSSGIKAISFFEGAPREFRLYSNYPNPFNPATEIQFTVPKTGYATLKVFNILGQEVETLFEGVVQVGKYIKVTFNASNLASGVYFARLENNGLSAMQQMVLAK